MNIKFISVKTECWKCSGLGTLDTFVKLRVECDLCKGYGVIEEEITFDEFVRCLQNELAEREYFK